MQLCLYLINLRLYNVCHLACTDLSIKKGDDVVRIAILSDMPEEFHENYLKNLVLNMKKKKLSDTKYEDFDLNDNDTWDKFTFR